MGLIEDNDDEMIRLLKQIRNATQGFEMDGQDGGTQTTGLRVHDVSGQFTPPANSLNLVNQHWEDDKLSDASLSDLAPGDTQTITSMLSTSSEIYVAAKATSTTEHTHDYDGDGNQESAVEYTFEYRTHQGGDSWNTIPGMNTTLPIGYLGNPIEIIPGKIVGPMAGFRIRMTNVTDGEASTTTIPADELGAQIAGMIIRTGGKQ